MTEMKKHLLKLLIVTAVLTPTLGGCADRTEAPPAELSSAPAAQDQLWQVSTLSALMEGVFDGEVSVAQIKEKGDLGVGTFEGVDGEMVVLDGTAYRVRADGTVSKADDGDTVPFAAVTFFEADQEITLKDIDSYAALTGELDKMQSNPNLFYAWKISGTFSYMKTRSVPKQSEPYPTLAEVTANQPVFEFQDVKGTLVGLWCPEYIQGVNASGFHLHFLTEDARAGGHVLECALKEGTAAVDVTTEFAMLLPQNQHFAQTDLSGKAEEDIKKVEGDN